MPTTPNMNLVLPVDHGSADVWGAIQETAFGLVDLHDHTTGKGVPVPSAALRINADVAWNFAGTFYALTGVKALDFEPQTAASMTGYASVLFTNSSDANNLYFRNQSGTNVKITDGSTLNVSIVGGIGGDYTSIGALVDYDDASDTYRFRQQTSASVRQFAKMQCADIKLTEYDPAGDASVPANFVTLKSPDALAASYDVTWPAAVPGTARFVQMSTAGVLSVSNTTTDVVTALDFKHTTNQILILPASSGIDQSGSHTRGTGASGAQNHWILAASTNKILFPIDLKEHDRITGYAVWIDKNTNGSATIAARLFRTDGTAGTETALGAGSSSSANAPNFITLVENGLTIDLDEDNQYYLMFTPSGSVTTAADLLYHVTIAYTRP
jgi:hypothetical protein